MNIVANCTNSTCSSRGSVNNRKGKPEFSKLFVNFFRQGRQWSLFLGYYDLNMCAKLRIFLCFRWFYRLFLIFPLHFPIDLSYGLNKSIQKQTWMKKRKKMLNNMTKSFDYYLKLITANAETQSGKALHQLCTSTGWYGLH